jgi:hypothetical protein
MQAEERQMAAFLRQHEQAGRGQNHVKVFANVDAAEKWFEDDPEASRSSARY